MCLFLSNDSLISKENNVSFEDENHVTNQLHIGRVGRSVELCEIRSQSFVGGYLYKERIIIVVLS